MKKIEPLTVNYKFGRDFGGLSSSYRGLIAASGVPLDDIDTEELINKTKPPIHDRLLGEEFVFTFRVVINVSDEEGK